MLYSQQNINDIAPKRKDGEIMANFFVDRKNGQLFVKAAGGDIQSSVMRRAARIALRENGPVNYDIIHERDEYETMTVDRARKFMTAAMWVNEFRDSIAEPLDHKDTDLMTVKMKKQIIAEFNQMYIEYHRRCIALNNEMSKAIKILGKVAGRKNKCICPKKCDCQDPEPKSGPALLSNLCPEHNLYPIPDEECPAEVHRNGAIE